MKPTNILLENDDVEFVRSKGYTLSGFVRVKINELKDANGVSTSTSVKKTTKRKQGDNLDQR